MSIQTNECIRSEQLKQKPLLLLTQIRDTFLSMPAGGGGTRHLITQPAPGDGELSHRLRRQSQFLMQLTVHGLLRTFIRVNPTLGKLPEIRLPASSPQHLPMSICQYNTHIGSIGTLRHGRFFNVRNARMAKAIFPQKGQTDHPPPTPGVKKCRLSAPQNATLVPDPETRSSDPQKTAVALALFDLDGTLLDGDSDHGWGEFLCQSQVVDSRQYRHANERFLRDYQAGQLDVEAYLEFALAPLAKLGPRRLHLLRQAFLASPLCPSPKPLAKRLLDHHRKQGDTLVILTSTNRFVAGPLAARLNVDTLLATEPEQIAGHFTGRFHPPPCYGAGKLAWLHPWLEKRGLNLEGSFAYSDSIADLPLLEAASHPAAVEPDPQLAARARLNGWPVISLKHNESFPYPE